MLDSELLRSEIGNVYNIDLEQYKWDMQLQEEIFKIELDKYCEDNVSTMKEVYEWGLNIGNCGLTSRYFAIHFPRALYHRGKCKLLVGTKKAPNGEHAWIENDGYVIDSTLMIKVPVDEADKYYKSEGVLHYDSARKLPEYNTYSNEMISKKVR